MLVDVLPHLACPHCGAALDQAGGQLRCASGHVFDIARQGYVNLVAGSAPVAGDSAEMVAARSAFLAAGHFRPITDAVVAAASPAAGGCVVDLGAGTGHYLAAVLDAGPDRVGLALEVSKAALRRAARAHPRLGAVGCDVWAALPVRDETVSLVLNVFAPRNPAELARVVRPGGGLVVVTPTVAHLAGLVQELGLLTVAPDKSSRTAAALSPYFGLSTQEECEFDMELPHEDVLSLVGMGPSAWHVGAATLRERMAALPDPVRVTASVLVTAFRRA
ncbi:putative RNA methyltransferase [Actinophytocola xanthii]|uniref:23S rRNA methyltransferase n=1 Tax=Actinophytocola xanthii TaxID=1912961 RepID=A0A1Q8CLM2_9PSEU|nr:methyltransferase domain-containing protein [Actinophytocola xanthii]OLF15243.1 23S rRNA methyltransferase [Actinophytocola xanthii]